MDMSGSSSCHESGASEKVKTSRPGRERERERGERERETGERYRGERERGQTYEKMG
jgi:hypothetical protein